MSNLQSVKDAFLSRTLVTNFEKKYLNAEPFNITIESDVLKNVMELWTDYVVSNHVQFDAIAGLPDAGNRYSTAFALEYLQRVSETDKRPLILPTKKNSYPASWKNVVEYYANSFTGDMEKVPAYVGGVTNGQRILLVDDVIAKGDTAIAAIKALQQVGAEVVGLLVVFDKIFQGGYEEITNLGVPVYSPIRVESVTQEGIHLAE